MSRRLRRRHRARGLSRAMISVRVSMGHPECHPARYADVTPDTAHRPTAGAGASCARRVARGRGRLRIRHVLQRAVARANRRRHGWPWRPVRVSRLHTGFINPLTVTFSQTISNFYLDVYNGLVDDAIYQVSDNNGNSAQFTLASNLAGGTT